ATDKQPPFGKAKTRKGADRTSAPARLTCSHRPPVEALRPWDHLGPPVLASRLSAQDDHEEVIRAKSGRSPNSAVGSSVEHPLGVGNIRADVMNAPPCPRDTSVSISTEGMPGVLRP